MPNVILTAVGMCLLGLWGLGAAFLERRIPYALTRAVLSAGITLVIAGMIPEGPR